MSQFALNYVFKDSFGKWKIRTKEISLMFFYSSFTVVHDQITFPSYDLQRVVETIKVRIVLAKYRQFF